MSKWPLFGNLLTKNLLLKLKTQLENLKQFNFFNKKW